MLRVPGGSLAAAVTKKIKQHFSTKILPINLRFCFVHRIIVSLYQRYCARGVGRDEQYFRNSSVTGEDGTGGAP